MAEETKKEATNKEELGRIRKDEQTEIIIERNDFGGKDGIMIREYITSEKYTGYTKSGTKILISELERFKEIINKVKV